jgi:hypothetical protein
MSLPIAIGNTETAFADGEFTVSAGTPVSLFITSGADGVIPSGVDFELAFKTAGGKYNVLLTLNASNILERGMIYAPATYAVRRLASATSAGLEKKS